MFVKLFFYLLGYVRLATNLGPLNIELHCDMVPKTCENFINLCKKGYYNNTKFHRSIKHFMVFFFLNNKIYILKHFLNRFKEEILPVLAREENLSGEEHLKMNSSPTLPTPAEEFYQWRIQELIPTNLSCKY